MVWLRLVRGAAEEEETVREFGGFGIAPHEAVEEEREWECRESRAGDRFQVREGGRGMEGGRSEHERESERVGVGVGG
jgi:hypothetical protein